MKVEKVIDEERKKRANVDHKKETNGIVITSGKIV